MTLFSSISPQVAAEPTTPAAAPSLSAADVVARVLATYVGSERFRVHFVQRTWEWYESGQVSVDRSREMRFARYAAVVAFWSGDPTESFSFELLPPAPGKNPPLILTATPKAPSADCARALFYVSAATHRIERVVIRDRMGNRRRFDIKRVEPIQ